MDIKNNKKDIRYFFNLRKQLFLFFKLCFNDGLLFGETDDKLEAIIFDVNSLFLMTKYQVTKEDYPYAFNEKGEQIGGTINEYKK